MAKIKAKEVKKKRKSEKNIDQSLVVSQLKVKEKATLDYYRRLLEVAKSSRKKIDWEWVTRDLFIRGYQFARYNPTGNTFVLASRTKVRIPINLALAQMRSVKNQVTGFQPKWEVLPRRVDDESQWNAQCSGKLLDYLYRKLGLRRKIKEAVIHGLKFSVGVWQIGWDDMVRNGEDEVAGEVFVNVVDPFDFFVDPNATSLEDAEYVIKALRKPVAEIKSNPNYSNTDELGHSGELAASEYKAFLMQALKSWERSSDQDDDMTILYELWKKERDDEGQVKMRIVAFTEDSTSLIRDEVVEKDEFPFLIYSADINPLEIYGEGWARHVIALNRVINALEGGIFEYNHIFAKGRYVIDKNSGVRLVANIHGQIIEKNRGAEVTSLPISPLPQTPFMQITNFLRYIEDLGGAHDVSLGRVPAGVRSGVGIAQLRQNDAVNQADLVDNLEDFLVQAGQRVLNLIAENYISSRLVRIVGKEGSPEYFLALGEGAPGKPKADEKGKRSLKQGGGKLGVAIIGKDNEVRVTIGSWLNQTLGAKQERLEALYEKGAIDQETLLEHLEFGDIESIIQRTREEKKMGVGPITAGVTGKEGGPQGQAAPPPAQAPMQGAPQGMPAGGGPPPGMPVGGGPGGEQENLARAENQAMMVGRMDVVQVDPGDDHQVHIPIHQEILNQVPQAQAHISEHEAAMGGGAGARPGGSQVPMM